MRRNYVFLLILVICYYGLFAQQVYVLDLEKSLKIALERSYKIRKLKSIYLVRSTA